MNNQQVESILEFEIKDAEMVPPGQYIAVFKDVQKTVHEQFGEGAMFIFEIAHGEYKGRHTARIGKKEATTQNITGKMIASITGSILRAGERPNLKPFLGKYYNVLVESAQNNKTRLAQVWPYEQQQYNTAPASSQTHYQQPSSQSGDFPF